MKSGGTHRQKAERLMLCHGRELSSLPASVFVKGAQPAGAQDAAKRAKHLAFALSIALSEAKVAAVAESLNAQPGTVIDNTAQWVVKKQAQNYDELKADLEREDLDDAPEGSDAEVRSALLAQEAIVNMVYYVSTTYIAYLTPDILTEYCH
jgi:splicing factor 3A subunit 3